MQWNEYLPREEPITCFTAANSACLFFYSSWQDKSAREIILDMCLTAAESKELTAKHLGSGKRDCTTPLLAYTFRKSARRGADIRITLSRSPCFSVACISVFVRITSNLICFNLAWWLCLRYLWVDGTCGSSARCCTCAAQTTTPSLGNFAASKVYMLKHT